MLIMFSERKDELKLFRILRCFVGGLFIISFLLYLAYLINNLITDTPMLKIERSFLDELEIPDMAICSKTNNFQILLCDIVMKDGNRNKLDFCNGYIIPEVVNLGKNREFCYTFKANKTMKFAHPYNSVNGLEKIRFHFYLNIPAAEEGNLGIASISVQFASPDFNPWLHPKKVVSQMDKAIQSEIKLQWSFIAGMANYAAVIKFRTSIYKSILPGDVSAIIGFGPSFHITPNIETSAHCFPFNGNKSDLASGATGYFSVAAGSFVQEQKIEERSTTILSSIAAAGGAFGIIGGAWIILFGDSRLNPWGIMHMILRHQLIDRVVEVSSQHSDLLSKCSTLSQDDRIKHIEYELSEIKVMIEYMLDTSFWKKKATK